MRARAVSPPTILAAFPTGVICSIPTLLGITYDLSKALPNNFQNCLIPTMRNANHLGGKLKQEAERLKLRPAQVAELFGVKPPSVYDWYEHGRIHKKHYAKLVEMSGKPLTWWLEIPESTQPTVAQDRPSYSADDPRHAILLLLFEGLPTKEQDELIRTLTEKKQHYDAVIDELLSRRNAA